MSHYNVSTVFMCAGAMSGEWRGYPEHYKENIDVGRATATEQLDFLEETSLSSVRRCLCSTIGHSVAQLEGLEVIRTFLHWPFCIYMLNEIKPKFTNNRIQSLSCLGSLSLWFLFEKSYSCSNSPNIHDIYFKKSETLQPFWFQSYINLAVLTEFH